jgi:hypothetical protein
MKSNPRDSGRNAQLVRTLQILRELTRNAGLSLAQLAEYSGTTERTVRRDLAAFQEAGFPLSAEELADHIRKYSTYATLNLQRVKTLELLHESAEVPSDLDGSPKLRVSVV